MKKTLSTILWRLFLTEISILLLGTMPSPKSRQEGFYYMHPQNKILTCSGSYYLQFPPDKGGKRALLLANHIALMGRTGLL